jgi:hypothetical protein
MDLLMVQAYAHLVEPVYSEVKHVLTSENKPDAISSIFENNNVELLHRIYEILVKDWAKQCFCIYEALLQSGLKELRSDMKESNPGSIKERIRNATDQICQLVLVIAAASESVALEAPN